MLAALVVTFAGGAAFAQETCDAKPSARTASRSRVQQRPPS